MFARQASSVAASRALLNAGIRSEMSMANTPTATSSSGSVNPARFAVRSGAGEIRNTRAFLLDKQPPRW
jgi:hypothetical protein